MRSSEGAKFTVVQSFPSIHTVPSDHGALPVVRKRLTPSTVGRPSPAVTVLVVEPDPTGSVTGKVPLCSPSGENAMASLVLTSTRTHPSEAP